MSPLTVYLARFLGLFCLLMCAALFARPKAAITAIHAMMRNPGLMLLTGIATLAGGVAMVVGHNVWSGGVLPVVVTLAGWLTLIKGIALLVTPPAAMAAFYRPMRAERWFRLQMGVAALFSLWLTVAAFQA